MRIKGTDRLDPRRGVSRAQGGTRAEAAAFARLLENVDDPAAAAAAAPMAAPLAAGSLGGLAGGLSPFLGFGQQQADPPEPRARALALLDQLDQVRVALLTGSLPSGQLQRLTETLASTRQAVSDPRLTAILDEVDLRAQVELAKLERAQAMGG